MPQPAKDPVTLSLIFILGQDFKLPKEEIEGGNVYLGRAGGIDGREGKEKIRTQWRLIRMGYEEKEIGCGFGWFRREE